MKKRYFLLGLLLAVIAVFSSVTLAGCGVSMKDVKASFESLDKAYKGQSAVFTQYSTSSNNKYSVEYGATISGLINEQKHSDPDDDTSELVYKNEEYRELVDKYHVFLEISSAYIDETKTYILGNLKDGSLKKDVKNELKTLNKAIENYIDEIKDFSKVVGQTKIYFETIHDEDSEETDEYRLMVLKKEYGKLINKNIKISSSMAKIVELTDIQKAAENAGESGNQKGITKKYIQTKMLPIYSKFLIEEISTKIVWNVYKDRNAELKAVVDEIEEQFENYRDNIVKNNTDYKALTAKEVKDLMDRTENFLIEAENYYKALKDFSIADIVKYYNCSIDEYTKKNEFARIDLAKMEQFLGTTLPNFVDMVKGVVFA